MADLVKFSGSRYAKCRKYLKLFLCMKRVFSRALMYLSILCMSSWLVMTAALKCIFFILSIFDENYYRTNISMEIQINNKAASSKS